MTIDPELHERVRAVRDEFSTWRIPPTHVIAVQDAVRRLSTAMGAGDDRMLGQAVDDLELLGPVRGLPLSEHPGVPVPDDVQKELDATAEGQATDDET